MSKAPVSACIIVRNEPQFEQCLKSIRDYVEEIVVVDTGSTDGATIEIAKKYADIFESYTECNDPETGLIENFSMARQRSFDLATKKAILWLDSDDIIVGLENINKIIESTAGKEDQPLVFMFPYEYSYNELGQCTCTHYRERLIFNKQNFHWTNPVHEVLIPNDGVNAVFITGEQIVWKHQRQYSNKPMEPSRNLRILRKYYEKVGDSDARQLYYLGLECCNSGLVDESIELLTKYIDVSGWDDERAMACLKLIEIYQSRGDYKNGLKWGFKTIEIKETWGEGYFCLGKMFYFIAQQGGPNEMRNWERCANYIKMGLNCNVTKTLLFINPLERDVEIHRYYNMALNKLGDIKSALESVETALKTQPNDAALILNKRVYQTHFANIEIAALLGKLKEIGKIDDADSNSIYAIINKTTQAASPVNYDIKYDDVSKFPIPNISNNSDLWVIPETYDYDKFPLKLNKEQLQAVVIMIWKQFMLHDEVLSAISFLENAPYVVRHTFATEKALGLTKACIDWMDNKDIFQDVNDPKTINGAEAGTPLPNGFSPNSAEAHRFNLMLDHMNAGDEKVVDFGSMDGGYGNRYSLSGHKTTGLDCCQNSVNIANAKAAEFNTGAKFICTYFQDAVDKVENNHFDVATSSDTYEHVKDPVNDILIPAKKMLKDDGKFLLCTPHGCWTRGQYISWALPFSLVTEGKSWLYPFTKTHLIAPTVWTVVKNFRDAGYYVKNCYADLLDNSNDALSHAIVDQGNIFAEAYASEPEKQSNLDIVFWIGDGIEIWTPETFKKTGLGGSETMAIEQAKRLAALGNRVRVYAGCGPCGEGIYDGVEYMLTDKYQDLKCDVLIVSRRADMLDDQYNIEAKLKLLIVHDVFAINATNKLLLKADRILALSEWHKQNLINVHNVNPEHVLVTRNGIDLTMFDKDIVKDQYKCINSSSPDRAWPVLLQLWPRIKERVPQATLTLAYGFKNWEYGAQWDEGQRNLIQFLKNKIIELAPFGVNYIDRVSTERLCEEIMSSGCWVHPTWFTETSCLTAMMMQAGGVRMVTSSIAALNETVGERGVLIDGDWTSEEYQNKFVDETVKALLDMNNGDRIKLKEYAKECFGLDSLLRDWNKMFIDLIELKKTNPIIPYQPTTPYKTGGMGYYNGDTRIK